MDNHEFKLIAAVVSLHTTACLIEEYLQESGHNVYREFTKVPSKNLKDILSARNKLNDVCEKMFPNYNFSVTNKINEISYKIEDLIIDELLNVIENGQSLTR